MNLDLIEFELGDIVYLRIGGELVGMVTGIVARPDSAFQYLVTWDTTEETSHWDIELTKEKPLGWTTNTTNS